MPNWTHDTSYEGDDTEAVLWTVLTLIIAALKGLYWM